jgi:hypothetical protein
MKGRRLSLSLVIPCLLFGLLSPPASPRGQSAGGAQWGATVEGLQMSVAVADEGKAGEPELLFTIRNVGEKDVILNLGMMLANGKVQLPNRISFSLTDSDGKAREFHFFDPRHAVVAGRVDPYAVPLRSGSAYALRIGLDNFHYSNASEWGVASKLPAGRYQITARFEGDGAMLSYLVAPSWAGRLQSNTLTFEK